eukprot:NODE_428_length_8761_cov_0.779612.p6 type:complete len:124 gc:universal NODE_428_length_8761_cov_0.779612:4605-4234(-)
MSASSDLFRGLRNIGELIVSNATILQTSSLHSKLVLFNKTFAILGSKGNSAILLPSLVSNSLESNAFKDCSNSIDFCIEFSGGVSIKGNDAIWSTPSDFSNRQTLAKFILFISGVACSLISFS